MSQVLATAPKRVDAWQLVGGPQEVELVNLAGDSFEVEARVAAELVGRVNRASFAVSIWPWRVESVLSASSRSPVTHLCVRQHDT